MYFWRINYLSALMAGGFFLSPVPGHGGDKGKLGESRGRKAKGLTLRCFFPEPR